MSAIEMVCAQVTAPGAGGAAMAAVSGNSLTIRNTNSRVRLIAIANAQQAVTGTLRITSPLLHDNTVGITSQLRISVPTVEIFQKAQNLEAQDTLSLFRTGSGTAGDIESSALFIHYDDLPGVDAKLILPDELARRGEDIYSWNNSVTMTAAGGYTGSQAINATQDQLKANREYAIVGVTMDGNSPTVAAIRLVGPDWGNLGIGVPNCSQDYSLMSNWFPITSKRMGRPGIPVFNSANKTLTFISGLANENGSAFNIGLVAVLLAPTGAGRGREASPERMGAMGRRGGKCK